MTISRYDLINRLEGGLWVTNMLFLECVNEDKSSISRDALAVINHKLSKDQDESKALFAKRPIPEYTSAFQCVLNQLYTDPAMEKVKASIRCQVPTWGLMVLPIES